MAVFSNPKTFSTRISFFFTPPLSRTTQYSARGFPTAAAFLPPPSAAAAAGSKFPAPTSSSSFFLRLFSSLLNPRMQKLMRGGREGGGTYSPSLLGICSNGGEGGSE